MSEKHSLYQQPAPGHLWELDSDFNASLGQKQLQEATRPMPVLVLFHFIAAITIHLLAIDKVSSSILLLWQLSVLLAGGALLAIFFKWKAVSQKNPRLPTKQVLGAAIFLAAVWSVPLLIFSKFMTDDSNFIVLGIVLAMMSMGIVTMLRLPASAIAYTSFLSVVLSAYLYSTLLDHRLLGAVICLIAGAGLVVMVVMLHSDFQRKTHIESANKRQSQTIRLLLNDFERETSDWLWETDQMGKITYHSPSLKLFVGTDTDTFIKQDFLTTLAPSCAAISIEKFRNLISERLDIENFILEAHQNNIVKYWQISARPKFDGDANFEGYDGVSRDITHRQNSELQVRAAKEAAEQASSAKSQFLAVISHELRTPINAIVGFSEVLLDSQSDNISGSNRKAYLDTILESAKQLQALINNILDATRVERGVMHLTDQDIDAAELIEVAIKICRNQATESDISMIARVQEDVNLSGDLTRLKQVLVNLLTNAIKFSPPKTVVNIDMNRGADSQLIISIRDAGIGISTEDEERIFEPFVQLDEGSTRRFGGVGLGLSIARRIARLHGGDVTIRGSEGIGTEARLIIPAARLRWPNPEPKTASQAGVAA